MCGIAGFIDLQRDKDEAHLRKYVSGMNASLAHRGPDGSGIWLDPQNGIALGHTRLSIIDLSEHGHQPMTSADDRYVLTYNGEIYNFQDIKARLSDAGQKFRGTSDTEVLLSAIQAWGLEKALSEINGMFAFALWDKKNRLLHLARDRLGKKPLYYGLSGKTFLFASELKALRAHPAFTPTINRNALAAYTRHGYVPAPHSIYEGIFKLPPASTLSFSIDAGELPQPRTYWDLQTIAERGEQAPADITFEEAKSELEALLMEVTRRRMISDVPLGVFLSGGIDSSLITALMQKQATQPVKSFCIGFGEGAYNEAQDAKKIAAHLGTNHTEFYVSAEDARNVIPDLPRIYDEPFADPSQIPTYHVSRLAKQHVTVTLSGDGGDESFAGYSRYHLAQKLKRALLPCPLPARKMLASALGRLPLTGRARKVSELLSAADEDALYTLLMSYWKSPEHLVKNGSEPMIDTYNSASETQLKSFIHKMMYQDTQSYLPDDILTKVDRASMAVSLETRAPLLDYKVVEYAWSLPLHMKMHDGPSKRILRAILEDHVPRALFDRPKQGFAIPLHEWLRGPLREWAETLLDERKLETDGFFHTVPIRQKWEEHLSGKHNWGYQLWGILMFQAWHESQT